MNEPEGPPLSDTCAAASRQKPQDHRRDSRIWPGTILVLITIAGICLGWIGLKAQKASRREEAVNAIRAAGGSVDYDYAVNAQGDRVWDVVGVDLSKHWTFGDPLPHSRRHIPVSAFSSLDSLTNLQELDLGSTQVRNLLPLANLTELRMLRTDNTLVSDLSPLANLTKLRILSLTKTQVSVLSPLAKLGELRQLYLSDTRVADVSPLANLTGLRYLALDGTDVSDLLPLAKLNELQFLLLNSTQVGDLSPLANLTELRYLELHETRVSDLSPLANLTELETLVVRGLPVSPEAIKQLNQALPNCEILVDALPVLE